MQFSPYGKSPPPYGEGLYFQPNHLYTAYRSAVNFQPDHLYTTYRSVVNFLCTHILARTKRKVNRTFLYNFMLNEHELCTFYVKPLCSSIFDFKLLQYERDIFRSMLKK